MPLNSAANPAPNDASRTVAATVLPTGAEAALEGRGASVPALIVGSIGVVYGDIGT
ncbi:MAG: hypothetical protein HYZ60_06795, partial [Methylocystis sp.]|nr:hypothetical protein [Methylocystis sp.]